MQFWFKLFALKEKEKKKLNCDFLLKSTSLAHVCELKLDVQLLLVD